MSKSHHDSRIRIRRLWRLEIAAGVFLAVVLSRCSVKEHIPRSPAASGYGLEIPRVDAPEFLVVCGQGRYALLYDTLYRQAAWVAYVLTRQDVEESDAGRRNRFVICPAIQDGGWPHASSSDYAGSGFDRGHLVPSADRMRTQAENDATFRMSNIAPQTPRLNRGQWSSLEEEVRRMAQRLDTLWIVTGSELKPGLARIGAHGIGVPERFFKVLLARRAGRYAAIGFVLPNAETLEGSFREYAVPVEAVEALTGIDFFPGLPDALEARVEAEYDSAWWE